MRRVDGLGKKNMRRPTTGDTDLAVCLPGGQATCSLPKIWVRSRGSQCESHVLTGRQGVHDMVNCSYASQKSTDMACPKGANNGLSRMQMPKNDVSPEMMWSSLIKMM